MLRQSHEWGSRCDCLMRNCLKRSSAADEVEDQHNHGNDQKEVDEPAGYVEGKTQKPKNEQNYKDRPKHIVLQGSRNRSCAWCVQRDDDPRKLKAVLLSRIAQGCINRWRRSYRTVFGAQKRNQLSQFIRRNRGLERGHLLAAVLNLVRDLGSRELLADVGQRRTFLSALAHGSVAVSTAFVAEQDRTRFLQILL